MLHTPSHKTRQNKANRTPQDFNRGWKKGRELAASFGEQNIGRLEVAVEHAVLVNVGHSPCDLRCPVEQNLCVKVDLVPPLQRLHSKWDAEGSGGQGAIGSTQNASPCSSDTT
jgi:hypothetical protein